MDRARRAQIQDILRDNEAQSNALQSKIVEPKNSIAPVYSLPAELLACIFKIARQREEESGYMFVPKIGSQIQNALSRVSRSWREAAINTSCLWSSIYCEPSTGPMLLDTHLQYSRACPLDIRLYWTSTNVERLNLSNITFRTWREHLLKSLIHHANRWRRFDIQFTSGFILREILSSLRDVRAPLLEHFGVENVGALTLPNRIDWSIFDPGAPALSSLSLHDCQSMATCFLHHRSVTTLQISSVRESTLWSDWAPFRRLLLGLSALTHLSIRDDVVRGYRSDFVSVEIGSLLVLEITTLNETELHTIPRLCTFLSTPALERLVLNNLQPTPLKGIVVLAQSYPIPRRYPALRTLELRSCYRVSITNQSYNDWKEFIRVFPNITHLIVHRLEDYNHTSDSILTIISSSSELGEYLPRLASFTISSPVADDILDVGALVSSRITAGYPMHQLIFENPPMWSPEILTQIEMLREQIEVKVVRVRDIETVMRHYY
jgi:hypothetical protein